MQKQYLTNEINFRNLIKDKKDDEENFERIFSLVFKPNDLFDEGNQNKLYFQESFTYKNKFVIKEEIEIINKDKKISINNITEINQTLLQNKQKIKNNFKIEERGDADDIIDNGNKKNERTINIKSTFSTIKRKVWKRGPYKTKNRVIVKEKFDDKCFPFTKGKGLINFIDNTGNVADKSNEIKLNNEENLFNTTFKINRYFKDSKGKIKKLKKRRKYKPDDIRKKIKLSFHKSLKNIINENLKKTGSEGLFSFLPQTFLANISKMFNNKYMNSTYEDLLAMDFTQTKAKGINLEIEQRHYNKNIDVLNYLENNPEISKKSGFNKIKKMKYKDLLEAYFSSKEFEDAIIKLKNKRESDEYIETYIFLAKNYINYYSN